MIWLGILIGFILGLPIGFIKWNKNPKPVLPVAPKYLRRGIILKDFTTTDASGNKNKIQAQYEVGELESTDKLSKIEVIVVTPSQSEYLTNAYKKTLTELIDKSWIDSSEINWITTTADVRNRKIDEILN